MQQSNWKKGITWYLQRLAHSKQAMACLSLGLGLCLAGVFSVQWQAQCNFAETCAQVRADTLRLHVQANSNSVRDQTVKLQVRDAVLAGMAQAYEQAQQAQQTPLNQAQSICIALQHLPELSLRASKVVAKAGLCQRVQLALVQMPFATTAYETVTLPAGEYTALRVTLGSAEGKNWWCVLYPTFCVATAGQAQAAQYETPQENEVVLGDYAVRFALVEWCEAQKQKYLKNA